MASATTPSTNCSNALPLSSLFNANPPPSCRYSSIYYDTSPTPPTSLDLIPQSVVEERRQTVVILYTSIDICVYLIHALLGVIGYSKWTSSKPLHKSLSVPLTLLIILPPLIHLISVSILQLTNFQPAPTSNIVVWANEGVVRGVSYYTYLVVWVLRGSWSLGIFVKSLIPPFRETHAEKKVRQVSTALSVLTLIVSPLLIASHLNALCLTFPSNLPFVPNYPVKLHEWFHISTLVLFLYYVTSLKPSNQPQQQKQEERLTGLEVRKLNAKGRGMYSGKVESDDNDRPVALRIQSSALTLLNEQQPDLQIGGGGSSLEGYFTGLRTVEPSHAPPPTAPNSGGLAVFWRIVIDICAVLLGSTPALVVFFTAQKQQEGLTNLTTTLFANLMLLQFGFGVLNPSTVSTPPILSRWQAVGTAVVVFVMVGTGVGLSPHPFLTSGVVWPLAVCILLSTRPQPLPLIPPPHHTSPTTTNTTIIDPSKANSPASKNPPTPTNVQQAKRHAPLPDTWKRYWTVYLFWMTLTTILVHLMVGMYIPFAISASLAGISVGVGLHKKMQTGLGRGLFVGWCLLVVGALGGLGVGVGYAVAASKGGVGVLRVGRVGDGYSGVGIWVGPTGNLTFFAEDPIPQMALLEVSNPLQGLIYYNQLSYLPASHISTQLLSNPSTALNTLLVIMHAEQALLDPWMVMSIRKKGGVVVLKSSEGGVVKGGTAFWKAALGQLGGGWVVGTEGVSDLNVAGLGGSFNPAPPPIVGGQSGDSGGAREVPWNLRWGLACVCPALIGLVLVVPRLSKSNAEKKPSGDAIDQTKPFAGSSTTQRLPPLNTATTSPQPPPTALHPRPPLLLALNVTSSIAWAIFAASTGTSTTASLTDVPPHFWVLAILGFLSAALRIPNVKSNPTTHLLGLVCTYISLGACGAYIFTPTPPTQNLQTTGVALFTASQLTSLLVGAAKVSRLSWESELGLRVLSGLGVLGCILASIGLGRSQVDLGLGVSAWGPGALGCILVGSVACAGVWLGTLWNVPGLNGLATFLGALEVVFAGATLGTGCVGTSCGRFQASLILIGAGMLGCAMGLGGVLRGWNIESEEARAQRMLLRYQAARGIEDAKKGSRIYIQSQLRRAKKKASDKETENQDYEDDDFVGIIENHRQWTLKSLSEPFAYIHKSQRLWTLWRATALGFLLGWLLFIGGFGSSVTMQPYVLACACVLVVCGPVGVGLTGVGLCLNARRYAALGHLFGSIALFMVGVLLNLFIDAAGNQSTSNISNNTASSVVAAIGASVMVPTLIVCLAAPFWRLHRPYPAYILHSLHLAAFIFYLTLAVCVGMLVPSQAERAGLPTFVVVGGIMAPSVGVIGLALDVVGGWSDVFEPQGELGWLRVGIVMASLVQVGCAGVQALVFLVGCNGNWTECRVNPAVGALVFVGCAGVWICSTANSMWWISRGEVWVEPDNELYLNDADTASESSQNSSDASESQDGEKKIRGAPHREDEKYSVDLHGMLLAWPGYQQLFKSSAVLLLCSSAALCICLGASNIARDFKVESLAPLLLCVVSLLTPFLLITWVCKGYKPLLMLAQVGLLVTLTLGAYTVVYAAKRYTALYTPGILISSAFASLTAAILLVMALTYLHPPTSKTLNIQLTIKRTQLLILSTATIGWIIFVICFGIQSQQSGNPDPFAFSAALVFIITTPACLVLLYVDALSTNLTPLLVVRGCGWAMLCLSLGSLGVMANLSGANISRSFFAILTLSSGSQAGIFVGSVLALISFLVSILHRTGTYEDIPLNETQQLKQLTNLQKPTHRDQTLPWLHMPTSKVARWALYASLLLTIAGWLTLVISYGLSDISDAQLPQTVVQIYILALSAFIFSGTAYLNLPWLCLLAINFVGLLISLPFAGACVAPVIQLLDWQMRQATQGVIYGGLLSLLGLLACVGVVLHPTRPVIPIRTAPTAIHVGIMVEYFVGWVLVIVGVGVQRGGSGAEGYVAIGLGFVSVALLVLEKSRPGRALLHWTQRMWTVWFAAGTIVSSGAIVAKAGWAVKDASVGAKITFAGGIMTLVGGAAYLLLTGWYVFKGDDEEYLWGGSSDTLASDQVLNSNLSLGSQRTDDALQSNLSVGTQGTPDVSRSELNLAPLSGEEDSSKSSLNIAASSEDNLKSNMSLSRPVDTASQSQVNLAGTRSLSKSIVNLSETQSNLNLHPRNSISTRGQNLPNNTDATQSDLSISKSNLNLSKTQSNLSLAPESSVENLTSTDSLPEPSRPRQLASLKGSRRTSVISTEPNPSVTHSSVDSVVSVETKESSTIKTRELGTLRSSLGGRPQALESLREDSRLGDSVDYIQSMGSATSSDMLSNSGRSEGSVGVVQVMGGRERGAEGKRRLSKAGDSRKGKEVVLDVVEDSVEDIVAEI
ncbi:hypothetical protein HDV05_006712 [Chytridiales sp. JEL 0842]|nr:hypothetical protein HDV05_006712 [Chytridiales sp. JEL 0842]